MPFSRPNDTKKPLTKNLFAENCLFFVFFEKKFEKSLTNPNSERTFVFALMVCAYLFTIFLIKCILEAIRAVVFASIFVPPKFTTRI
jgi:hypothetical protein